MGSGAEKRKKRPSSPPLRNLSELELESLRERLAIQLWESGNVGDWYLKSKQNTALQFIKSTRDPFFEAGRRYGKTTTVLGYVIEECIKRPGIIIRWCEPWKYQCREIVMAEMDQIQKKIPEPLRFRWKQTDSYYEHPFNGSKIYLRGVNEDRGESARGTKAHIIVADELGTWREPKYVLDEVLGPQLLTTQGKLIRMGTPPRNLTHLFYEIKDKAIAANRFIQRTVLDQEVASWGAVEDAIERAGGWNSPSVQREYLCRKVIDKNFSIIPEWDDRFIVDTPRDEFFPLYLKYTGMDIGVRDLTVVLIAYYDFLRAKLVFLDEIVMSGPEMTTEKLAEKQRAKESEEFGVKWSEVTIGGRKRWKIEAPRVFNMRRVSDIDLLLIQDLSILHGLYYEATDKGALEEMVNQVRIWVGAGKIEVNPKCEILIDSMRYGIWDEDRKKWERSERLGHFDALAALMYLVRNVDTRTNPIPIDFGRPAEDHWIDDGEKHKRRENLKKLFNVK